MTTSLLSGTVTFLFTDLEGSTQLWETYPETLAQHAAGDGGEGHLGEQTAGERYFFAARKRQKVEDYSFLFLGLFRGYSRREKGILG